MKKLLIITPHLSTGGAPQVTANKVNLLKGLFDLYLIEHAFVAWKFVVQRNRIINTIGNDRFFTLGDDKTKELINLIDTIRPDVISMEEFPEMFLPDLSSHWIYRVERPYTIIETTHDSSFNPAHKRFMPDKFVFVSAYNSLKYKHLNVPFEIIEYPVDKKQQSKSEYRTKLGLEHDYKHVVIIGLFTPRKNQKYAFELCHKLQDFKIKFHFLGNQADNFSDYWLPLMDWKRDDEGLKNCVIWGERSDTDDFLKAVDLFLFPSKGDRGNKELNPIVIKEAFEYDELPKLFFNLDVYLNRHVGKQNVHFLTGDLNSDAELLKSLTKANNNVHSDEVVVIGTYPNLKSRVQLTKETINSVKSLGRKVLLISHYPVDLETQRLVDYYIFDSFNPLCHHSYYTRFYNTTRDYHAEVNINGLKYSNQSLTVLVNLFTAAKFLKEQGYKSFFYSTYDVIIKEEDINTIEIGFDKLKYVKAFLGTLNTPFGKGIQTNGMFFDIEFFLNCFDDVKSAEEFNKACERLRCQNFLEDYLMKCLDKENEHDYELVHNKEETLLKHSGLGVASNSEYYSILPVTGNPGEYMFYFFTYNIDDRFVNVRFYEDGTEFYNQRFQISKSREFKKEIKYHGKPIEIILDFFDGDNLYKSETYKINERNLEKFQNTGHFKWLNKKPKVKLVHIQTTLNDDKEVRSRESLSPLKNHQIGYVLHTNEPYKDLPPKFNCQRPDCVSMNLFSEEEVKRLGTALTPAHYGCFDAFKNAILSEFDECDYLIVCEGDCLLEVSTERFTELVYQAAEIMKDNGIGYFSFGDTKTLEHGWPQSPIIAEIPNQDIAYITNHIIGIQCIMFPAKIKSWLRGMFMKSKWDAADIFFNNIFRNSPYKMGILKNRVTTQADGFSLIDNQNKKFI